MSMHHRTIDPKDKKNPGYEHINERIDDLDENLHFETESLGPNIKKKSSESMFNIFFQKKAAMSSTAKNILIFGCLAMWALLFILIVARSGKPSVPPVQDTNYPRKDIKPGSDVSQLPAVIKGIPILKVGQPVLDGANATLIYEKNIPGLMLCKMNVKRRCYSNKIVDSLDLLYAIEPIYAEIQSKHQQMYDYHKYFISYMHSIGIRTIEFEALYPDQKPQITPNFTDKIEGVVYKIDDTKEPTRIYMQTHFNEYFYYRENLLNVAAQTLIDVWEYIIWIDAHQYFLNPYWWEESIYKMEHYNIVQLFQNLTYMKEGNQSFVYMEFASGSISNYRHSANFDANQLWWLAGNAWGIRKDVYLKLGYILDTCISGGCDYLLTYACMPGYPQNLPGGGNVGPYYSLYLPYVEFGQSIIQTKAASVRGNVKHFDHYHFFDYVKIMGNLTDQPDKFNLERDLYKDEYGLLHLKNQSLAKYFDRMS